MNESITTEMLIKVLRKALSQDIKEVSFKTEQLQGGTVGEIKLVYGLARTSEEKEIPYKIVYKRQKKWERYGDPDSWRREYDLYEANLDTVFSNTFRWPKCYYMELSEDETQIWMEYIEGISGTKLTSAMYEQAAEEIGKFQGRLYAQQPEFLNRVTNLSKKDYSKNFYLHYRSWNEVYDYIRAENCEIPRYLCEMLIDADERSEEIWAYIEKLPIVLCHRDFWVANIFYMVENIRLIDWDTAGWGYLGEDIASLIADEADVVHMVDNYERCVKAYYKGFSEYVDITHIKYPFVKELIIFMFGYRLVEAYKFVETSEERDLQIKTLHKIYEIGVL